MAVLMVMPSAIKAQDTVYIGNGNHNNFTGVLPTYTTASYSMTQQLYTAAEIGRAGTITVSRSKAYGTLRPAI